MIFLALYLTGVIFAMGMMAAAKDDWYEKDEKVQSAFVFLFSCMLSWFFIGYCIAKDP